MSYETLRVTQEGEITRLELNRPEKRNALSARMIAELTDFASRARPETTRAVVLSGAGAVFCAGGDLDWMRAQIAADRATRMAEAKTLALMLKALNEMPVPLIAAVHGGAYGGGVGLACVTDVAIAAPDARFGLTETRLGLIPATIAPYVLARLGEGKARRVFMSARIFGAEEAVALGVVARTAQDPLGAAMEEAQAYLKTYPAAVAAAKGLARRLAHRLGPAIDEAMIDDTVAALADAWEDPAAAAGIAAFFAKHKG